MTRSRYASESEPAIASSAPAVFTPRVGLAAWTARVVAKAMQSLGRGGTALPGLIAEKLAPHFLPTIAKQVPGGIVLLTGTNGKTTTAHMLSAILDRAGKQLLRNAAGSNLSRGIASELARWTSWQGRLRASETSVGLFEIDEAAFARAAPSLRPKMVAFTNLFRDQLDRYGEVNTVAALWQTTLANTAPTPLMILNADDPLVAHLKQTETKAFYFGIDAVSGEDSAPEHAADVRVCATCGQSLRYERRFYAHLGHFHCPAGHRSRPRPVVSAVRIAAHGIRGTELDVSCLPPLVPVAARLCLFLPIGGLYNVYNALAAITIALALGVPPNVAKNALSTFTAAFGRMEQIALDNQTIHLLLAKNPTGLNQVIKILAAEADRNGPLSLLVALNDLDADGRDVSWIWDADLEELAQRGRVNSIVLSGRRAADLGVRLKYAGISESVKSCASGAPRQPVLLVETDLGKALSQARRNTPADGTLHIVPTYTALLELRGLLTRPGAARPYWRTA